MLKIVRPQNTLMTTRLDTLCLRDSSYRPPYAIVVTPCCYTPNVYRGVTFDDLWAGFTHTWPPMIYGTQSTADIAFGRPKRLMTKISYDIRVHAWILCAQVGDTSTCVGSAGLQTPGIYVPQV